MKASHILWSISGWMFLLLLLGSFCFLSGTRATCILMNREPDHSISHRRAAFQALVQALKRRAPKELTALWCFALWSDSRISANEHQWGLREPTPDLTEVSGTCTGSFQAALPFLFYEIRIWPCLLDLLNLSVAIHWHLRTLSRNTSPTSRKHYSFL